MKEVRILKGVLGNEIEGKATYAYDQSHRLIKILHYSDISRPLNYTHTQVTYTSNTYATAVSKGYGPNGVYATNTKTIQLNGDIISITLESKIGDILNRIEKEEMTFAAPCGITQNEVNYHSVGLPPYNYTQIYNYTDANCSYKLYNNGSLVSKVTNDDKNSPYRSPESFMMGIIPHNYTKFVSTTMNYTETVTYTYNANNYPTKAVHTFSHSSEDDYTEYFTYY